MKTDEWIPQIMDFAFFGDFSTKIQPVFASYWRNMANPCFSLLIFV
jgi:hypothetical protein